MSELKKKGVILPLQAIRAIACLMIFLRHGGGSRFSFGGAWGVSVFFVLSGFVLVYSYWDRPVEPTVKSAAAFSFRKIKKLFPLHVIMLIVGLICAVFIQKDTSMKTALLQLGLTIPLLQTWFPKWYQALNSVDWYLSATLFLYFAFPFILDALKKHTPKKNTVFLLALCIYLVQFVIGAVFHFFLPKVDIKWIVYCFPPYRLGDFAIGCLVGYLFTTMPESVPLWNKNTAAAEFIILPLTVLSWAVYYFAGEAMRWFTYTCLFLPFSVSLIAVFAKAEGLVSRLITNRAFLSLAGVSSCFFLIHRQMLLYVHYGFKYLFHVERDKPATMVIGFVLTLLAIKAYQAVEKRAGESANREK